ncbi:MAG: SDR family oxidoreductase [Hyphomicrobiales bacterium]|nr:SDR family oxidoreductase [Hyphomicrobiales bacterium]MDE2113457.1 SDR family oxidoreductase [Hyphomicrobiales bacterium]
MGGLMVVTGGSRGIGRAVALRAAALGYNLVINYVNDQSAADEVVVAARAHGVSAIAVQGDVAREADILSLFAAADKLGQVTALINNAGVVDIGQRVDEMSAARITRMFSINVLGSFLCAREAVKRMSTRHGGKGGVIVNLSSVAATLGGPGEYIDYAASKGAIDTFTIGLAKEVATEGIRVNAVSPGITATDIHASGGKPTRAQDMARFVPMQRPGTADEVAAAVLWLVSGEASYVTGANLAVTGGR